jgi:hypothetical protein
LLAGRISPAAFSRSLFSGGIQPGGIQPGGIQPGSVPVTPCIFRRRSNSDAFSPAAWRHSLVPSPQ